jgi:hypothetical protein
VRRSYGARQSPRHFGGAIRYCYHPFGIPASPGFHRCPSLRKPPQHSKHSRRDDFLERRIVGRHFLRPHDGGSYLSRRERPWRRSQSILRKPGKLIMSEVPRAPVGPLWRNGIGICARWKEADRGIQVCEVRPLTRDPFFEVVNVAADFSALEAKGGNDVAIGHAPNLGADPIHFLWQLRHNTGNALRAVLSLAFTDIYNIGEELQDIKKALKRTTKDIS